MAEPERVTHGSHAHFGNAATMSPHDTLTHRQKAKAQTATEGYGPIDGHYMVTKVCRFVSLGFPRFTFSARNKIYHPKETAARRHHIISRKFSRYASRYSTTI